MQPHTPTWEEYTASLRALVKEARKMVEALEGGTDEV